jgi:putative ABC transport system substrate-binding protein
MKIEKFHLWKPLLLALLAVSCVFFSGCRTKKQQKVYRVGIVSGVDTFDNIADGFKAKMTELGYIEGNNIVYNFQTMNNNSLGVERVARQFVTDEVDLIFAYPTEPALAAKAAAKGTDIPVLFAQAGIEENDLVESVSYPGGNITGVRYPGPECTTKCIEILHELVPAAKRVYLIYDPGYPNASAALGGLRLTASSLGVKLVEDPVNNIEEMRVALKRRSALDDIGIDAIQIMPDILDNSPDGFDEILKFANKHKVPISGGAEFAADLGSMFSFVPDFFEVGAEAAILADRVFKGTPAGTIMVVTPTSRLRLNHKKIQQLGLLVPEGLLSRADEIIH